MREDKGGKRSVIQPLRDRCRHGHTKVAAVASEVYHCKSSWVGLLDQCCRRIRHMKCRIRLKTKNKLVRLIFRQWWVSSASRVARKGVVGLLASVPAHVLVR